MVTRLSTSTVEAMSLGGVPGFTTLNTTGSEVTDPWMFLATQLSDRGVEVDVLTRDDEYSCGEEVGLAST